MRIIRNIFNLIKITLKTYRAHRKNGSYHKYVASISSDTIRESIELNDGSISEKLYLKKQWYKVSTLFMGELLGDLLGDGLDEREKKSLVYLGATMGLCDVLVDDYKISKEQIYGLLLGAPVSLPSAIEKMFVLYYQELLETLPISKKNEFVETFKLGVDWQLESLKQFSNDLSKQEVKDITYGKGGISIELCKQVLNNGAKLSKESMMSLGAFIQAMNDTQDLPKDTREHVQTYVHYHYSFTDVYLELEEYKNEAFKELKNLDLDVENKSFFLFCFYSMYTAICYKLDVYSKVCKGELRYVEIAKMNKSVFSTNPYSLRSLNYCFKRIVSFNY